MTDAERAAAELAETLRRVNQELADNSRVSQQTQDARTDAEMKAKYKIENYTAATKKGSEAIGALASAGMAAGKAMLDGKKGAAAFNSSLDELSNAATAAGMALSLLIPGGILVKGLIAGITAITTAYIKYTQAANEMADKLSKGYQGLAKAGGAAADGMTGVFKDAKKLGLSMNELDQMVSLVAENSKEFALFGGSVGEGRKRFADLSEAMAPARKGLMNLGMDMKEINEGAAGYIRLQSRVGAVQNKTTQELADSTKKYLVEQDALTKLTGMTRQDQEKSREEIRSQERFAAKLEEVRSTRGEAAAKALEDTYLILKSKSREAAQGFADLSTGMITTEAARKQNMSDQGESIRQSQAIIAGQQTAAGAAQEVAKVSGATAKAYGTSLALMGVNNNVMSDYAGGLALGAAAAGDGIAKAAEKVKKDQEKQAAGADKITDQQSELVLKQMEANKQMEQFIFKQIPNAQKHMMDLADAAAAAARALNRAFPDKKEDEEKHIEARRKAVEDAKIGGMMSDTMLNDMGMDFGNLSGADGGVFKGPESGYPVLMHGTEAIVPMDKLSGARKMSDLDQMMGLNKLASAATNNQQSVDNPDADKMEKFVKSMLKDTESLTKITETDLNRTKNFSLLQTKLFEKKTALMGDELELLDEQNEILEQMLEIAEKAGGKEAAAAMKKSFTMARMGMSGGGMGGMPSMGGGMSMKEVDQMVSRSAGGGGTSNLSAMGGGQGLKASSTDLLQFGGASGSASNFEGLDDRLETAVLNAASEYNSLTGNKLKINSAKRDPEDQLRLYQETVDAGRPGIGPSGMPVGRPGTSSHERGLAVDIQNYNDPAALKALNGQGLHQLVPKDPVHFQLSGETGMIADGPESGYQATLHGKEAVIPMQNNSGDFVKMFEAMAEGNSRMVAMMEQMVSAQKNSVDVQTKMLRAQS
jgi:hypothetical protein